MIKLIDLAHIMKMIGCNIIQKINQIIEVVPTLVAISENCNTGLDANIIDLQMGKNYYHSTVQPL